MADIVVSKDLDLENNQVISRYMDLPKFVDLLRTSELHLERAGNLDDQLEGTMPESIRKDFIEVYNKEVEQNQKSVEILEYENKLRTNISCWTLGSEDNMALWKIYGGSAQSLSVSTTVEHLISSAFPLCDEGNIILKKVRYINHAGELPNGVYSLNRNTFGLKHEAYFFEREVRLVVTRPLGSHAKALRLPVVVNNFLKKITVSPLAGEWFFNLVTDLTEKYNVTVPVEKSSLSFLIEKAEK